METIKIKTYVGSDGILKLEMPVGVSNSDLEVLVVVHAIETKSESMKRADWLGFIEATAGSLEDDPIERGDQGIIEVCEPIE
jgi:hypothetical protein